MVIRADRLPVKAPSARSTVRRARRRSCRSPRRQGHPAGPHDRGAGRGRRHPSRAYDFVPDQIQPASLDLRLGEVAYRVRASFLPGPRTTVAERIDELKLHEIALGDGAVLETGCVYIVPLIESLALPRRHRRRRQSEELDRPARRVHPRDRRRARAASTASRAGYHGPLYAEISPRTFPVLVREGSRLSQIRFRRGHALLDAEALRALHERERLVDAADADVGEGIAVGVDLAGRGPRRASSATAPSATPA